MKWTILAFCYNPNVLYTLHMYNCYLPDGPPGFTYVTIMSPWYSIVITSSVLLQILVRVRVSVRVSVRVRVRVRVSNGCTCFVFKVFILKARKCFK